LEVLTNLAASIVRNVRAEWLFYAMLGFALCGGLVTDLVRRRNLKERYLSRFFLTDVLYAVTDLGHFWHFLVLAPLSTAAVAILTPWLAIPAVGSLPLWVQVAVAFVFTDFCNYWYHRAQHTNKWLWQFHKVHHSQEQLSSLSTFRQSILTRIFTVFVLAVPAAIMSAKAETPMIVVMILLFHQALEHSNTSWTYGPLGLIFVSPSYHEVHHSRASEHRNKNLSPVLIIWDRLFDSRAERGQRELEYGLAESKIPESYLQQMIVPAMGIYELYRSKPEKAPA
jgi:sterol desaturase/sphingolipid hydroxylase (fatty acid hydroxylase superfamily)